MCPTARLTRGYLVVPILVCLIMSVKQLSVSHVKEHGLDGKAYRIKYGIPRTQTLAAKEITSRRKEIVQRSRPWEKTPTYLKAQEKAQQAVAQKTGRAQRKKTAKMKA